MSITADLLHFLRCPVLTTQRQSFDAAALMQLIKLWGLTLGLAVLTVTIAGSLYVLLNGELPAAAEEFEQMTRGPRFFWMAVIMAPVLEESLFRSWLGFKRGILMIMPILLCFATVLIITSQNDLPPSLTASAVICVLGALVLYLRRYSQTKSIAGRHDAAARRVFPVMFWGSALMFGLIHMGNYAVDGFQFAIVLLVLPQFMIGLILGFVRMRYGLLAAMGFHGAYNGVFVAISVLA